MTRSLVAVLLLLSSGLAGAMEPFTVSDIRVEGLQKISAGTIFNYLPIKVGDQFSDSDAGDAIRALYRTGFFADVQLEQDGDVLIVIVRERPSIARIDIVGNDDINDDALREAMQQTGFTEGRIFNQTLLDQVVQELKNEYFNRGRYAAEVEGVVTPLERNRVGVTIDISEGEIAKIKGIDIIGNEAFSEDDLLDEFSLSTRSWYGIFSRKDRYSKQKLTADLENFRSFYQDRGYLDFAIDSTQVTITPDKQDIFITITVIEGEQFTVGELELSGETILPKDELLPLITVLPGEVYSRRHISEIRSGLASRLADEGYLYANVNAIPDIDNEANTVGFSFAIDPGRRVYVRRIDITGNIATQDEVIRRELRQVEGAWYSAAKIRRSRERLFRLGFFDDVVVDTPEVPGSVDQVDMNVTVKERATGSFLFGVGFSDEDGVLLQGSVSQRNLFGTGREIDVAIDNSAVTEVVRFEYRNPYHTIDGVSRGFSLVSRQVDAAEADTAEYILDTLSVGVDYQFPLSETDSLNVGIGPERVDLESTPETPPEFASFITTNPTSDLLKITANLARDTRDSIIFPTKGSLRRAALELTGGDLEYYKLTLSGGVYRPLTRNIVIKGSTEIGYGDGVGDTVGLPFFKNFFAGGPSTVRGFDSRSLGPRDSGDTPEATGGSARILVNASLLFPFPGASEDKDKRLALFIDGGQVYDANGDIDLDEMRYSGGIALNWLSAVGPLNISYALPIRDEPGDDLERLQFTLGTFFR
ncbi:MAG: outer membrane protein assembly factor BamA [Gammaproteobacteria bacterium]|nr:outer membrane protein assembly factor BamA [Gammaproteobacteria bacterium]